MNTNSDNTAVSSIGGLWFRRIPAMALWFIVLGVATRGDVVFAQEGQEFESFVRRTETDERAIERFYGVPWCEERWDRLSRFLHETQTALQAVEFNSLNQHGRVDYLLLSAHIDGQLAEIEFGRRQLADMDTLLPFRATVVQMALQLIRMESVDAPACSELLSNIPDEIKTLRERIEKGRHEKAQGSSAPASQPASRQADEPLVVSPVTARRAAGATDALRNELREWYDYHAQFQPDFPWWTRRPYEDASKALEDYARFLREEIAGLKGKDEDPLVGDPIGREALLSDLREEFIAYSPEELVEIGQRELAWCQAEMKKIAAAMGLGDDWKAALKKIKEDHVGPGSQDELVTQFGRNAVKFLKERDLITVPALCEETWRLFMLSPDTQKTLPFAAYGGQSMLVAYAAESMKHDDKLMSMRGNNRHFTRIVVPHELIPGHHLQAFMAARERPYRQMFNTPFLVEGWCLYWEMLLWDLSYAENDADRLGMLFWRNHRAARIIVSLKFHLGQMTPAEMVEFLLENVGMEKFGATSEVRRFIGGDYSPLYQCGYMIGGLQIRALRRELVDTRKMTNREFHDAIMKLGPIPIEMIRATLTNAPLARGHASSWKFAE